MDILKKVLLYYVNHYPIPSQLSNSRMTKMVYLMDWKSCIENGKQISNIKWIFYHYGPYVDDVSNLISRDNNLGFKKEMNDYGRSKNLVVVKKKIDTEIAISDEIKKILNHIIDVTSDLNYDQFIRLVYSTYPVVVSNRYDEFDLVKLASDYAELKS